VKLTLRDAEIANVPFFAVLAGCSSRRFECRVASHTSEKQQRNAPVSAVKNGMLVFSESLKPTRNVQRLLCANTPRKKFQSATVTYWTIIWRTPHTGKPAWKPEPRVRLLLPAIGKAACPAPYSTVTLLARLRGLCDHITSLRDMSAPQAKNLAASPCGIYSEQLKS
jgi:hypothetical protein